MVAIVSGNGAGLGNSSAVVLGQQGLAGAAGHGKAKENVFLNIANGNLSLQHQDDFVAANGIDFALTRTYNSVGSLAEGMGAQWKTGLFKQVANLTGNLNTANSTVSRIDGDGSMSVYSYDANLGLYVSTDGDGPYRTLQMDKAQHWVWRDNRDGEGLVERYDSENNGRIVSARDRTGLGLTYQYNGKGLVSKITNASGDATHFDYDSRDNLAQVRTVLGESGLTVIRVRYSYDQLNRLHQVASDLTPNDGEGFDGKVYATDYTYDGNSNRIAMVKQSDGSSVGFTYQQHGGVWKVASIKEGSANAATFDYSVPGQTKVTDPAGRLTTYSYDGAGRLTQVVGPNENGVARQADFAYDAKGNVLSALENGVGRLYEYDDWGNRIREKNEQGILLIAREYAAGGDRLLEETDYTGAAAASTKLVYNQNGQLRFVVDAAGLVREHRYDVTGKRVTTVRYSGSTFTPSATVSEADLQTWASSLGAALASASSTDYGYDARGLVERVTEFSSLDGNGDGVNGLVIRYTHDQSGRVLQVIDAQDRVTDLAYDGIGRLLGATTGTGAASVTTYDDANNRSVTTLFAGWSQTSVYASNGTMLFTDNAASTITDATSGTDDIFDALGGDDVLQGGAGNDVYVFGRGDGKDTILADSDASVGKINTLRFKAGIAPADVVVKRVGNDLLISISGTTDSVNALSFFANDDVSNAANPLQQIQFANGDNWNLATITAKAMLGTGSADGIAGTAGDDIIDGGTGNDLLSGRAGNDTFLFGRGDGQDRIQPEYDANGLRADVLRFRSDVTPADITFARSAYDLVLGINGTTDTLTIGAFYFAENPNNPYNPVRGVQFDGGISWSLADLVARAPAAAPGAAVMGTAATETLTGTASNEFFNAGAGNDTINANAGNDVIVGGVGNDFMSGGVGSDVYFVAKGDGVDRIVDGDSTAGNTDTIVFLDVASTELRAVERQGQDLVIKFGINDHLTVLSFYSSSAHDRIESIRFADGIAWDVTTIHARTSTIGTSSSEFINVPDFAGATMLGGEGNDSLNGERFNDYFDGGVGNDQLTTHGGADTLIGGAGNDNLIGHAGGDTYIFARGHGSDTITDLEDASGGIDTILISDAPSTALIQREQLDTAHLFVGLLGRKPDAASSDYWSAQFRRGYTYVEVASQILSSPEGAVYFPAGATNNQFITTLFQRVLGRSPSAAETSAHLALIEGAGGSRGKSVDNLLHNIPAGTDQQVWAGKLGDLRSSVLLERVGGDLVIRYGANDRITVSSHFTSAGYRVESLKFSDGVSIPLVSLHAAIPTYVDTTHGGVDGITAKAYGSTISNALSGSIQADHFEGGAGNDTLTSAAGNDLLVGGLGNDSLVGGFDNDTYVFTTGDGIDSIYDQQNASGTLDVIRFTDVPFAAFTTRERLTVIKLYQAILGRVAGPADFDQHVPAVLRGYSMGEMAQRILDSSAGRVAMPPAQSHEQFVEALYQSVVKRSPTASEAQSMLTVINSAGGSRGAAVASLISNVPAGADANAWASSLGVFAKPFMMERSGTALILSYGVNDRITIQEYFGSSTPEYTKIERVEFSDGTSVDLAVLSADVMWYGTDVSEQISNNSQSYRLATLNGNDTLHGEGRDDQLYGGQGNDTIHGSAGNDTLIGGLGNDSLVGSVGNDSYVFTTGDGVDTIYDNQAIAGSVDVIRFTDVPFAAFTNRERLAVIKLYQAILGTMPLQADFDRHVPAMLRGYSFAEIAQRVLDSSAGLNALPPQLSNEQFVSSLYQSVLQREPSQAESLALISTITAAGGSRGAAVASLISNIVPGANANAWAAKLGAFAQPFMMERSGTSLILYYGYADKITIQEYFGNSSPEQNKIERIEFSDGTSFDLASLSADVLWYGSDLGEQTTIDSMSYRVAGMNGADTINGAARDDQLYGGVGNDTISGLTGNDTIIGGLGNDSLYGSAGKDFYVFSVGDGADSIAEYEASAESMDVIRFTDVSSASITTRERLLVIKTYQAIFGSRPTQADFDLHIPHYLRGLTNGQLAQRVLISSAGMSAYPAGVTDEAFIEQVYANALGRTPSVSEVQSALALINASGSSRGDFIASIISTVAAGADTSAWHARLGPYAMPFMMERQGTHLLIQYGLTDQITVLEHFGSSSPEYHRIERIEFSDGMVMNLPQVAWDAVTYGTTGNDEMSPTPTLGIPLSYQIYGLGGNDKLYGSSGNEVMQGGIGNDTIYGREGNDTIVGGFGDDYLDSGAGADVFKFTSGDGNDFVFRAGSAAGSQVHFTDVHSGSWTTKEKLSVHKIHIALFGRQANATELEEGTYQIQRGMTMPALIDRFLRSSTGLQAFPASVSHEQFVSSLYQRMLGRAPSSIELSTMTDLAASAYTGRGLVLHSLLSATFAGDDLANWSGKLGLLATPMLMEVNTNGWLVIKYGNGDSVSDPYFFQANRGVEQLKFADGVTATPAEIARELTLMGDDTNTRIWSVGLYGKLNALGGNDTLEGSAPDELLWGGLGNDTINAAGGKDTVIGGFGNDYMVGGVDNDVYSFSIGDGNDTIDDHDQAVGNIDTIVLRDVTSASYVPRERMAIAKLYRAILGREPEPAGLDYWMAAVRRGFSNAEVANMMLAGFEANWYYSSAGTDEEFVSRFYQRTFSREASPQELSTALASISAAGGSRGKFVDALVNGPMSPTDQATWNAMLGPLAQGVTLERKMNSNALIVRYGSDSIEIASFFVTNNYARVEKLRFADGVEMDLVSLAVNAGLHGTDGNDNLAGDIHTRILGMGGNDTISTNGMNAVLDGGAGDDRITGGNGADTLTGGLGNDTLMGFNGNDTYVFYRGDGIDRIEEYAGTDTILINVAKAELRSMTQVSNDLVIKYSDSDQVTVAGYFIKQGWDSIVENIQFKDGALVPGAVETPVATVGTSGNDSLVGNTSGPSNLNGFDGNDTLVGQGFDDLLDGGAGNDSISGQAGNDTLIGGTGSDILDGGAGSDTYSFLRGFGLDIIRNADASAGRVDKIAFGPGIVLADISVSRTSNNLVIRVYNPSAPSTPDTITVENWFSANANRVDRVTFADGSSMTTAQLELLANARFGTAGADNIAGLAVDEAILGLAGNDTITDAGGSDVIDGGDGYDQITDNGTGTNQLMGGAGNDTIRFAATSSNTVLGGSGNDLVEMTSHMTADASAQVNMITGGTGNDRLVSGSSADTYTFNLGDGQDTIVDFDAIGANKADRVLFGAGIDLANLRVSRQGDHLLIRIAGAQGLSGDQVLIENWYAGNKNRIEDFVFANGSSISQVQIDQLSVIPPNSNGAADASLGTSNATAAALGNASIIGQSRQSVYLNTASGNLVLQGQDDAMAAQGLDLSVLRTYNSQGNGWRMGMSRSVSVGLMGTLVRTNDDGAETTFVNFAGRFISTDGEGAYDFIAFNEAANTYTFTDGSTGVVEVYDAANNGRLKSSTDISGNVIKYDYDTSGRLSKVTNASLEGMNFEYDGANRLIAVHELHQSEYRYEVESTRVRYGYDAQGRLETVTTDLTPADNSIADGIKYVTTYGYEGDSKLVSSMTQTDGTRVEFTYEEVGGKQLLKTVTDALGRMTTLVRNGTTTTVDVQNGPKTAYTYNDAGQLRSVSNVDLNQTTTFEYDEQGNIAKITDAMGNVSVYNYDANGNQILQMIDGVQAISRTFGTKPGQMLTESVSVTPGVPGGDILTSRLVYDIKGRVRFAISAEGRVTENVYDAVSGDLKSTVEYAGDSYDVSAMGPSQVPSESELEAWRNGADKTRTIRTDFEYHVRGLAKKVTTYAATDASGAGIKDGSQSVKEFVYDQAGMLLSVIEPGKRQMTYAYDGLGRVRVVTDTAGQLASTTEYNDAGGKIVATSANTGVSTTRAFDRAGQLISVESKAGFIVGETKTVYNAIGRPVMVQLPDGTRNYMIYDEAGRKVADIDADGSVVEYVYNKNNQLARTTAYAQRATVSNWVAADGTMAHLRLSDIRPPADALRDRDSWNFYDAAGRLAAVVDDQGFVTETAYDGASRVVGLIRRANAIGTAGLNSATSVPVVAESAEDRISRAFYDKDGNKRAELDAEGFLTEHTYGAAGLLQKSVTYKQRTEAAVRAHGTLDDLRPAQGSNDTSVQYLYNGKGQQVGVVDALGYLTETVYDVHGNVERTKRYGQPVTVAANSTLSSIRPGAHSDDRITVFTYTAAGQLKTQADPDGTLTSYVYNAFAQVTSVTVTKSGNQSAEALKRYDSAGRMTSELPAHAAPLLAAATGLVQKEAVWNDYGTFHNYDSAGKLLSSVDANGGRTSFYYDDDNRLAYTVNAEGEVSGIIYNSFNQVAELVAFGTRIAPARLVLLTGGKVAGEFSAQLSILNTGPKSVQKFDYDTLGQAIDTTDALGNHTTTEYDGFGAAIIQRGHAAAGSKAINNASDAYARIVHDKNGRVIATLSATGSLTAMVYDANGNLTARTTYASPVDPQMSVAMIRDGINSGTFADPAHDRRERMVYDARGLLKATFVALNSDAGVSRWSVSVNDYDSNGNLVQSRAYSAPVNHSAPGEIQLKGLQSSADDVIERHVYDGAGRLLATASALQLTSGETRQWRLTNFSYDARGNVTLRRTAGLPLTSVAPSQAEILAAAQAPSFSNADEMVRFSYDQSNRLLASAKALGPVNGVMQWSVSRNTYDKVGNLSSTTEYATAITGAPADEMAVVQWMTPTTSAADRTVRFGYDRIGRLLVTVGPLGQVVSQSYDAKGLVVSSTAHYTPYAASGNIPLNYVAAKHVADRMNRTIFDDNGRPVIEIDSVGAVTERRYDALGRVVSVVAYAEPLVSAIPTGAKAADVLALVPNSHGRDRISHFVYDQDGRQRFSVDPLGYVKETRYDALGRIVSTLQYLTHVDASDFSRAAMATLVASQASSVRKNSFTYDAAGNLRSSTDALDKTETYQYDALGRKTVYTNKLSNTWTYSYDAAGRQVSELSPEVEVVDNAGNRTMVRLETRMAYDTLGNLKSRTEAAGLPGERTTSYEYDLLGRQVKTILPIGLVYDAAADTAPSAGDASRHERSAQGGSTVQVTYDIFGNAVSNLASSDGDTQLTRKVYDKEGKVRFEIDALGYVTGYEHNAFGEVTKLTRYAVSVSAGENPSVASVETALLGVNHAEDRSISKAYDRAGRLVKTTEGVATVRDMIINGGVISIGDESLARATLTDYNAFGETIRQRVVGMDGETIRTAGSDIRFYYNTRGDQVAKFAVVNTTESASAMREGESSGLIYDDIGGYLTESLYDDAGQVVAVREYMYAQQFGEGWTDHTYASHAPMIDDRLTEYVYDLAGKKTTEIVHRAGYQFFMGDEVIDAQAQRVTDYAYDNVGNLTSTTLSAVTTDLITLENLPKQRFGVTHSQYDAIGRVTAVITEGAIRGNVPLTPNDGPEDIARAAMVQFQRDVHGNVVEQKAYAQAAIQTLSGKWVATAEDAVSDRITRTEYDIRGNAIKVTDAEGNASYTSYDGFGRVAKQWQTVTDADGNQLVRYATMQYDAAGQLISVTTPGANTELNQNGRVQELVVDSITRNKAELAYNAFGELTSRSMNQVEFERTEYDAVGRAWRTNSGDGVVKVMFHNIAGQVTKQVTSAEVNLETFGSAQEVRNALNAEGADSLTYQSRETRYNMLGHVVSEHGSRQVVAATAGPEVMQIQQPITATQTHEAVWNNTTKRYSSNVVTVNATIPSEFHDEDLIVVVEYSAFEVSTEFAPEPMGLRTQRKTVRASEFDDGQAIFSWSTDIAKSVKAAHVYIKDITGKLIPVATTEVTEPKQGVSFKAPPVTMAEVRMHYPDVSVGSIVLAPFANYGDRVIFDTSGVRDGSHIYTLQYLDPVDGEWKDYAVGNMVASGGNTTSIDGAEGSAATTRRANSYQTVDRFGNVLMVTDPRDSRWFTYYSYNVDNKLVDTAVYENYNEVSRIRNHYDEIGRDIGSRDAMYNVNRKEYDLNGNVRKETFADGGKRFSEYNIFGDRTRTEYGHATIYKHDRLGRVVEAGAEAVVPVYFMHNVQGGMTLDAAVPMRVYDQFFYDELGRQIRVLNSAAEQSVIRYDLSGNIVEQRNGMNQSTRFVYDALNHKVAETDGNGNTKTWTVDAYGRAKSFKDLGGTVTTYTRNYIGEVKLQTSVNAAGIGMQHQEFTYEGGLLTRVSDIATGAETRYSYDLRGRRDRESTYAVDTRSMQKIYAQNNFIRFDQMGRIQRVADGFFDVKFTYDANGNRTRVETFYINSKGQHNVLDEHNSFDAMNRVLMVDASMDENGDLYLDDNAHHIRYNLDGQRRSDTYKYTQTEGLPKVQTEEFFEYDEAGRLTTVERGGQKVEVRSYDAAGRLAHSTVHKSANNAVLEQFGIRKESRAYAYDQAGRVARMKIRLVDKDQYQDDSFLDDVYYEVDGQSGYDGAGNLKGYRIVPRDDAAHTVTKIFYNLMDTYKEGSQTSDNGNLGSTTSEYDKNGHLMHVYASNGGRRFISDIQGNLLRKLDVKEGETRQLVINGRVLGVSNNDVEASGMASVYESASTDSNLDAPSTHVVAGANETLRSVAQSVWGDGALWYLIAEANGLSEGEALRDKQVLKIPARTNTLHNSFETFKPYSAADMIGSTTPVLPMPAAQEACGGAGPAIVMLVTAVVAAMTQQWWMMKLGETAGMMAAAATGAIAGQGAAIAMDMQNGFRPREIALAALSAGIGHGLGKVGFLEGTTFLQSFTRGAIGNALIQGISVKAGLQEKFHWRQVATAGVVSFLGSNVDKELGLNNPNSLNSEELFFRTATSKLTTGVTSAFVGGRRTDMGMLIADAFGNALGQSFAWMGRSTAKDRGLANGKHEGSPSRSEGLASNGRSIYMPGLPGDSLPFDYDPNLIGDEAFPGFNFKPGTQGRRSGLPPVAPKETWKSVYSGGEVSEADASIPDYPQDIGTYTKHWYTKTAAEGGGKIPVYRTGDSYLMLPQQFDGQVIHHVEKRPTADGAANISVETSVSHPARPIPELQTYTPGELPAVEIKDISVEFPHTGAEKKDSFDKAGDAASLSQYLLAGTGAVADTLGRAKGALQVPLNSQRVERMKVIMKAADLEAAHDVIGKTTSRSARAIADYSVKYHYPLKSLPGLGTTASVVEELNRVRKASTMGEVIRVTGAGVLNWFVDNQVTGKGLIYGARIGTTAGAFFGPMGIVVGGIIGGGLGALAAHYTYDEIGAKWVREKIAGEKYKD